MTAQLIHFPRDMSHVLHLLRQKTAAQILSGCTSFHGGEARLRIDAPDLIAIQEIPDLRRIRFTDYGLEVGACVTLAQLGEVSGRRLPLLLNKALQQLSTRTLYFQATVGGNVCVQPVSGDLLLVLVLLGASFELRSAHGTRWLDSNRLFESYTLPRESYELLTRIKLPEANHNLALSFSVWTDRPPFRRKLQVALAATVSNSFLEDFRFAVQIPPFVALTQRSLEESLSGRPLPLHRRDVTWVSSYVENRLGSHTSQIAPGTTRMVLQMFHSFFKEIDQFDVKS